MNRLYRKITSILGITLLGLLSSCIYEDEIPCPCEVHFVYDYNMEFADAFPSQVNDLILFVFDADGRFITSYQDSGDHLDANYRMSLQLEPGHYQLIAWAGLQENPDCYQLTSELESGTSIIDNLQLYLNTKTTTYEQYLGNLWHGMLADFEVKAYEPSSGTISLTKDVKRFKILLQDATGSTLEKDDYHFSIVAANHKLGYDNRLLECEEMTYLPYSQDINTIENEGNDIYALVAEMATLRLTDTLSARFIVRDEKEQTDIFNIDTKVDRKSVV